MADGTTYPGHGRLVAGVAEAARIALGDVVRPGRYIVAVCPCCSRSAPLEASQWLWLHGAKMPLGWCQGHVRCVCGGRRAELEVWEGTAPPRPDQLALYAFH
jgi:hypothetical protein